MSRPVYDIEHESDGWWTVTRNGWRLDNVEFLTREEAEAAIARFENEDEEAEPDPDDARDARADFEMDRDR